MKSEPLAELDRDLAATANDATEQSVCWCSLGKVLNSGVKMLQLVISELLDHLLEQRNTWMGVR